MSTRVIVGMSGGVDSSVAAALLVEAGYDVVGVTLRVWPWAEPGAETERFGSCCSPETVGDARAVARRLGIPYYLLNYEREFDQTVIADFTREYLQGRTPTPCVVCNRQVKFGSLLRRALAWEAEHVATGHYARIETDPARGRMLLRKGADPWKDQSYFLWPLGQEQLRRALFPVGGLTKAEVRARARALGLPVAEKPESQEICFVPGDYREFLRERAPEAFRPGPILDQAGRRLGEHPGLAGYTVGQRKRLGLATGRPRYVLALDASQNAVIVGDETALASDRLVATEVNFIPFDRLERPLAVEARIRHGHPPAAALVRPLGDGEVEILFAAPQRAVTPGQSVVFYRGDLVVGGGIIREGLTLSAPRAS